MAKRLKNRSMSMYSGPLNKMIDDAVALHMSALKATEGQGDTNPVWGDFAEKSRRTLEDGRTEITEARTGKIPGDNYDGSGGYAPDDEWLAFLETPKGIEYTKNTAPREIEEERLRFLEAVPDAIEPRAVDKIDPVERQEEQKPSYLQTPAGQQNIMELFNVNPETGGGLSENAKGFFDTSYSTDNPTLDVLKDPKWMRKARKEYGKTRYANAKPSRHGNNMPFEKWAMKLYKPKGSNMSLHQQAKIWEGDNPGDTDNSQFKLPDGTDAMDREITSAKDVAMSQRQPSNPFERYKEQQKRETSQEESPETTTQFKSSRGQSKMIKNFGKPMSFRKNR